MPKLMVLKEAIGVLNFIVFVRIPSTEPIVGVYALKSNLLACHK